MSIVATTQRRIELAKAVQAHAAEANAFLEKTLADAVASRHDIGTIDSLNRAMQATCRAIQQSRRFQRRMARKAARASLRLPNEE